MDLCFPQMEIDEEEDEDIYFSGKDLMRIRDAVALLLQSLLGLLQTFPLKDRPQSASHCTQVTNGFTNMAAACRSSCPDVPSVVCRSLLNCSTLSLSLGSRSLQCHSKFLFIYHVEKMILNMEAGPIISAQRSHQAEERSRDGFLRLEAAVFTKSWRTERGMVHGLNMPVTLQRL